MCDSKASPQTLPSMMNTQAGRSRTWQLRVSSPLLSYCLCNLRERFVSSVSFRAFLNCVNLLPLRVGVGVEVAGGGDFSWEEIASSSPSFQQRASCVLTVRKPHVLCGPACMLALSPVGKKPNI